MCRQLGVEFRSSTPVDAILTKAGRVTGISTPAGEVTGDGYVVALGSYSPLLLRRIGMHLPVYPVKGYSITVPVTGPTGAPEIDGDGRDPQGGDHASSPNFTPF